MYQRPKASLARTPRTAVPPNRRLAAFFTTALDGRSMRHIHAKMVTTGSPVRYNTVRRWLRAETSPNLLDAVVLFGALGLTAPQCLEAIVIASTATTT